MSGTPEKKSNLVRCPRCGYRLDGLMSCWTDSCPLDGVCAECGLEFSWATLIAPDKFDPPWWIETMPPRRSLIRVTLGTLARAFVPPLLWRRVDLAFPLRVGRVVRGAILVVLLLVTSVYAIHLTAAAVMRQRLVRDYAAMGMTKLTVPSIAEAVRESAMRPWSSTSKLRFSFVEPRSGRTMMYGWAPPRDLLYTLLTGGRWSPPRLQAAMLKAVAPWGAALLLMPLLFVLLPASVQRAKVRPVHVARIWLYALATPIAWSAIAVVAWAGVAVLVGGGIFNAGMWVLAFVLAWIVPLWLLWFWASAIGRYLRIPHGWWVSGALFIISNLLMILIVAISGSLTDVAMWYWY